MMPEPRPPVEYATKADLRELRQEIRGDIAELKASDIAELKASMRELRQEIRGDIAELKASIAEQVASLHKTYIVTLLGMTAIFGTLVTILKLFG